MASADSVQRGPQVGVCSVQPVTALPGPHSSSSCLLAVCAASRDEGIFPVVQPSAPLPSLRCAGSQPRQGSLLRLPLCHGGALLCRGAEAEGWGAERDFLAPLVRACIVRGSAESPRLLSWHNHTTEIPDLTSPKAPQTGYTAMSPAPSAGTSNS